MTVPGKEVTIFGMRRSLSHDYFDVVACEGAVGGNDGDALHLRLGDQQSVERVAVMVWQVSHLDRVLLADRKALDTEFPREPGHPVSRVLR